MLTEKRIKITKEVSQLIPFPRSLSQGELRGFYSYISLTANTNISFEPTRFKTLYSPPLDLERSVAINLTLGDRRVKNLTSIVAVKGTIFRDGSDTLTYSLLGRDSELKASEYLSIELMTSNESTKFNKPQLTLISDLRETLIGYFSTYKCKKI